MTTLDRLIYQKVLWQQAKGNLYALAELFVDNEKHIEMKDLIDRFVYEVENSGPIT